MQQEFTQEELKDLWCAVSNYISEFPLDNEELARQVALSLKIMAMLRADVREKYGHQ